MKKHYKISDTSNSLPHQILRIKVEAAFGKTEAELLLTSIRVLGYQVITTIIESDHPPETLTVVKPHTINGTFDNEFFSGVCIARDQSEISSIELNFISITGSDTASLIIPSTEYSDYGSVERYYLNKLIDQLTQDRYSIELQKDMIIKIILDAFNQMTGVSNLINQDLGMADEH